MVNTFKKFHKQFCNIVEKIGCIILSYYNFKDKKKIDYLKKIIKIFKRDLKKYILRIENTKCENEKDDIKTDLQILYKNIVIYEQAIKIGSENLLEIIDALKENTLKKNNITLPQNTNEDCEITKFELNKWTDKMFKKFGWFLINNYKNRNTSCLHYMYKLEHLNKCILLKKENNKDDIDYNILGNNIKFLYSIATYYTNLIKNDNIKEKDDWKLDIHELPFMTINKWFNKLIYKFGCICKNVINTTDRHYIEYYKFSIDTLKKSIEYKLDNIINEVKKNDLNEMLKHLSILLSNINLIKLESEKIKNENLFKINEHNEEYNITFYTTCYLHKKLFEKFGYIILSLYDNKYIIYENYCISLEHLNNLLIYLKNKYQDKIEDLELLHKNIILLYSITKKLEIIKFNT
jgi:hypothetical protein